MSPNKILLGLLIVSSVLVYWVYKNEDVNTENDVLISVLNNQETAISSLTRVVVSQAGQQFDMRKGEQAWHLNGGFYVRMDSLFNWIQALKNARMIEPKTANPENFESLSLTDDDLRVQLYQDNQLLTDVILGQDGAMVDARFVRFQNDNQSWLASGLNDLRSGQEVWQLTMLFDIPEDQVQAIELQSDNTLSLIKNNETGVWEQSGDNSHVSILEQEKVNKLAAALAGFRIQQAMASQVFTEKPVQTLVFGLHQGRQVSIAVYQVGDNSFIVIKDSQQPSLYDGWQFTVPNYKLATLLLDYSALLKPQSDTSDMATPDSENEVVTGIELEPVS